ncbi:MAG TPA: dephospho-CoA kinase [Candidatus Polarisedimenticolia bacterium]|nr:dephospho-CoA kinase [Candidatus Polarisedimenticolia bacterium]
MTPAPPGGPKPPPHRAATTASGLVLRVGLTGGIATGKTTVAGHFAAWGATVIDADVLARALVEPGAAGYEPVVREFGRGIVDPAGRIDRPALGRIVFTDAARRARLEEILHPLIFAAEEAAIDRLAASTPEVLAGNAGLAIVNAALLVEAGTYRRYQRLVVVHCDEAIQVERLQRRDRLTRDDALARIRSQMPTREKLKLAHYAIDTSGSERETETRSRAVFDALLRDRAAFRSNPAG